MATKIPEVSPDERWESQSVDTWRRELLAEIERLRREVDDHEARITALEP